MEPERGSAVTAYQNRKMSEPTKSEITQVFKRLRGVGPNKVSEYEQ